MMTFTLLLGLLSHAAWLKRGPTLIYVEMIIAYLIKIINYIVAEISVWYFYIIKEEDENVSLHFHMLPN